MVKIIGIVFSIFFFSPALSDWPWQEDSSVTHQILEQAEPAPGSKTLQEPFTLSSNDSNQKSLTEKKEGNTGLGSEQEKDISSPIEKGEDKGEKVDQLLIQDNLNQLNQGLILFEESTNNKIEELASQVNLIQKKIQKLKEVVLLVNQDLQRASFLIMQKEKKLSFWQGLASYTVYEKNYSLFAAITLGLLLLLFFLKKIIFNAKSKEEH